MGDHGEWNDRCLDNAYSGTRVVVLGATGFIGRWVARRLSRLDAHLFAVVRDEPRARELFGRYGIRGQIAVQDLADLDSVPEIIGRLRPHLVFNLAGYGVDRAERDERMAFRVNARLPPAVAESLTETGGDDWQGQRFIHVGSALEYGEIDGDLREDSTPVPTTLYGRSKLAGTLRVSRICRASGLRGLTARLFTVYGPGEHPGRLLPSLLRTARTGEPLELTSGDQERDFVYVEDVVDGLLRLGLVEARPGEPVNLATGRLTSVRRFIEIAADVLGIDGELLRFGSLPTRSHEMSHAPVNNRRLRSLTGWAPETTIAAGVRRTRSFLEAGGVP